MARILLELTTWPYSRIYISIGLSVPWFVLEGKLLSNMSTYNMR